MEKPAKPLDNPEETVSPIPEKRKKAPVGSIPVPKSNAQSDTANGAPAVRYCTKCSADLPKDALYCAKCGARTESPIEVSPQSTEEAETPRETEEAGDPGGDRPNDTQPEVTPNEHTKDGENEQGVPQKKPRKKISKGAAIGAAVGGCAVVVAIVIGILASSGAFLPPATRAPGELPNIPAFMAQAEKWGDSEFNAKFNEAMGVSGSSSQSTGSVSFTEDLSKKEFGLERLFVNCDSFKASGGGVFMSLMLSDLDSDSAPKNNKLYFLPDYNREDMLQILELDENYEYKSVAAESLLGVYGTEVNKVFQQMEKRAYSNADMLAFDSKLAEKLLSDLGISDYQVIDESKWGKSAIDCIATVLKGGLSKTESEFGRAYTLTAKTKDAAGKDIYLYLTAQSGGGNFEPYKLYQTSGSLGYVDPMASINVYVARTQKLLESFRFDTKLDRVS